jgi:hypothetical protein
MVLLWPDLDAYSAKAAWRVPRAFIFAILLGGVASLPFLSLADKVSPPAPSTGGDASSSATSIVAG